MKHHNFTISVIDTDSLTISKPDGGEFTEDEIENLTKEINTISDDLVKWEYEFYIPKMIIVKSKNYIMDYGDGEVKTKGSSIRDQKKEPILREMMNEFIQAMLDDKLDTLPFIYEKYCNMARNVTDIKPWCQKKTVTKSILNCKGHEKLSKEEKKELGIRKNETDVWDAIKDKHVQEGDKIWLHPCVVSDEVVQEEVWRVNRKTKEKEFKGYKNKRIVIKGLALAENYDKTKLSVDKLLERCYDTVVIFKNIINMDDFSFYKE